MKSTAPISRAFLLLALLFSLATSAHARDLFRWQDETSILPPPLYFNYSRYPFIASEDALYYPSRLPASRVPYPIEGSPGAYLFYDYVNRPYAFTPDQVWRTMFPGIQSRILVEEAMLGVAGQAEKERQYHASFLSAEDRAEAAARKAEEAARKAEAAMQRIIDAEK